MDDKTKQIEQPHSVKFSINAKGFWAGEVKCYGSTPEDAMTKATAKAQELEKIIKEKNGV